MVHEKFFVLLSQLFSKSEIILIVKDSYYFKKIAINHVKFRHQYSIEFNRGDWKVEYFSTYEPDSGWLDAYPYWLCVTYY